MPASPLIACCPFEPSSSPDSLEVRIVVGGPVEVTAVTSDDPPCAAIARPRSGDCVLGVVTARLLRQQTLEVAEGAAVLARIRERAPGVDQAKRVLRL